MDGSQPGTKPETAPRPAAMTVREATYADYDGIAAVLRRNSLNIRPLEAWKRIWDNCPFRAAMPETPIGWVMENDQGQIVGTYENIPSAVWWKNREWRTAISASWAVDEAGRKFSMLLVSRYFLQKQVDLLLNSSASPVAAKIMAGLKARPVAHPSYDRALYWITRHRGFSQAMLRQRNKPAIEPLPTLAGIALMAADAARGRFRRVSLRSEVAEIKAIDERFDRFWDDLKNSTTRLMSVRHAASLRWRFQSLLEQQRCVIFGLERNRSLAAYLILRRRDRPQFGLKRYQVADFQALEDRPDYYQALMAAALEHARDSGVHAVDLVGFHQSKQTAMEPLAVRYRKLPSIPYFYKPINPDLGNEIHSPDAWDPSPFDGDDSI